MIIAAAPSVICDELAAVMFGAGWSSDSHAGGSAAIFSSDASARMPSSSDSTRPSAMGTGTISPAKNPLSVFSAAR